MKRRYNHETNQWDIVLSEREYQNIQQELNKLNLMRMERSQLPISSPQPQFKCSYPCNCSGACHKYKLQSLPLYNLSGVN